MPNVVQLRSTFWPEEVERIKGKGWMLCAVDKFEVGSSEIREVIARGT